MMTIALHLLNEIYKGPLSIVCTLCIATIICLLFRFDGSQVVGVDGVFSSTAPNQDDG